MELYGIEVEFARTVVANAKLTELCPDHDISRFNEVMGGNSYWLNVAQVMEIMQNAAEEKKAYDAAQLGGTYEPRYLTAEQFSHCDMAQLNQLSNELLEAFIGQGKTTVHAKEKPGKKTKIAT